MCAEHVLPGRILMFFIISVHLLLERAVFGEKSCYLNHLANEMLGKETRVDTLWGKAVTKEHQENTKNLHRIFLLFLSLGSAAILLSYESVGGREDTAGPLTILIWLSSVAGFVKLSTRIWTIRSPTDGLTADVRSGSQDLWWLASHS